MENIEHRVIKLELQVDDHASELEQLRKTSDNLATTLSSIEKTLTQIKYLAMGAALVVVAQVMGIDKVLKLFF
jgi:prefoldin subunit 5